MVLVVAPETSIAPRQLCLWWWGTHCETVEHVWRTHCLVCGAGAVVGLTRTMHMPISMSQISVERFGASGAASSIKSMLSASSMCAVLRLATCEVKPGGSDKGGVMGRMEKKLLRLKVRVKGIIDALFGLLDNVPKVRGLSCTNRHESTHDS